MTVLAVALAILLASLIASGGALAAPPGHIVFVRSEPAPNARLTSPPPRVAALFEKEIDRSSTLRLLRSDASVIDAGPVRLETQGTVLALTPPALAAGVYVAHWRAIDPYDGHTVDGYFAFTIGDDPPIQLQGFALNAAAQNTNARLEITPGRLGENAYRLALTGAAGAVRVERALLRFTPQVTPVIGSADAHLAAAGDAFTGRGMELALRAPWRVTALVRFPGAGQDTPFDFSLTARAAQVTPTPTPTPSPTPVATPVPAPVSTPTPAATPAPGGRAGPDPAVLAIGLGVLAVAAFAAWRLLRRGRG